jgi:hypothetical protein|tara:strand:- start:131 stop:304 length:174 start_codon:yes stop_codon:yes gene_type:complete
MALSDLPPLLTFEEPLVDKDGKMSAKWRGWFRRLEAVVSDNQATAADHETRIVALEP